MYEILFYKDAKGNEPIKDYIDSLNACSHKNKEARLKLGKIYMYLELLSLDGIKIGGPYIKHIEGEIWELRPLRDRIFFFAFHNGSFVLLHHFTKKTQKTPRKEIEQAKRNMNDFLERKR